MEGKKKVTYRGQTPGIEPESRGAHKGRERQRREGRSVQRLSEQRAKGRQVQVNRHCDRLVTRATNCISNAPGQPLTRCALVPGSQAVQAAPPLSFFFSVTEKSQFERGGSKRMGAPKARGPLQFDMRTSRDCAHSGDLGGFKRRVTSARRARSLI